MFCLKKKNLFENMKYFLKSIFYVFKCVLKIIFIYNVLFLIIFYIFLKNKYCKNN